MLIAGALLLVGVMQPDAAEAQVIRKFINNANPYVAIGGEYDTNLYRVADETEMLSLFGVADEDEIVATAEAGFDTSLRTGTNQFDLDARVVRNQYSEFSSFNHTAGRGRAAWLWQGTVWNGEVGYRYDQRLRDFSNQAVPQDDLRKEHQVSTNLLRRLTTRWQAGLRASASDISFDGSDQLDQLRLRLGLSLRFLSRNENYVSFETDMSDGSFDNNSLRNYRTLSAGPSLYWELTRQTRFTADLRFSQRQQDNPEKVGFSRHHRSAGAGASCQRHGQRFSRRNLARYQ